MVQPAGVTSRIAALDLLSEVLNHGHALDQALQDTKSFDKLESSDRAFARMLVSVCLRHLGEIDITIDRFLKKPISDKAVRVRHILRVGATQLIYLGTPPHAAVGTSVALAKGTRFAGFSGLINAVLRRVSTLPPDAQVSSPDANTPEWLFKSWVREYGGETASEIALAHTREAHLDVTVKRDPERTAAELNGHILPTGSIRLSKQADLTSLPGFTDGDWWVQDAAAALPARLIPDPMGKRVFDLCAAPGGKSAQLAAAGALVTAVDISPDRLRLVRENFERLHLDANIVEADILDWRPSELADAVLLDAPCTATGTIRRHPDIPHLKQHTDMRRLAKVQTSLIEAAAKMVRPGGHLIYAVCSLQPEESDRIINKFLLNNSQFKRDPIKSGELAGADEFLSPAGDLRTLPCYWPEIGGLDGFFAARIIREGGEQQKKLSSRFGESPLA